jgi:dienelactone hydrolase
VTRPRLAVLALALVAQACATAPGVGPTRVRFSTLDQQATAIDGYLVRPPGGGPHPAVVLMHGCGGLLTAADRLSSRETDWAELLAAQGYTVLMVDSFTPRGIQRMCSPDRFDVRVYLQRPRDAYGALQYLQGLPFVRSDRVAVVGWSQGGGVVLLSVRADSLGRPPALPRGDFRAAVAFYPASCREGAHRLPWTSPIPTLVLVGELDNWTPAGPCQGLVAGAAGRGSDVRIRVYPGAYHDFDWPGLPMRARPEFRTAAGLVPVTGMDSAAREDAQHQVTRFLAQHLGAIVRGHPP